MLTTFAITVLRESWETRRLLCFVSTRGESQWYTGKWDLFFHPARLFIDLWDATV